MFGLLGQMSPQMMQALQQAQAPRFEQYGGMQPGNPGQQFPQHGGGSQTAQMMNQYMGGLLSPRMPHMPLARQRRKLPGQDMPPGLMGLLQGYGAAGGPGGFGYDSGWSAGQDGFDGFGTGGGFAGDSGGGYADAGYADGFGGMGGY